MSVPRYEHAALRLLDGRVLVVGGTSVQDGGEPLASAEIFDPVSGAWSATGSMRIARRAHEAVRLTDGRVLVMGAIGGPVGGSAGSSILRSAEVYEPSTGTWSSAGSVLVQRYGHTALRLRDGRVLVVGSHSGSVDGQRSTELYDPATGRWSTTGSTATGRMRAGLVELEDDRVLVVGGYVSRTSCEVWSPVSGTWAPVGSTIVTRDRNALLLARLSQGRVLVAGNNFGESRAEIFDPAAAGWRTTGALSARHFNGVGVQLDNGEVIFGGGIGPESLTSSLERYDEVSETWSVVGALGSIRSMAAGVPLEDGGALFLGGYVNSKGASGTPVGVASVDRLPPLADLPGGADGSCALSVTSIEAKPQGTSTTISLTVPAGKRWARSPTCPRGPPCCRRVGSAAAHSRSRSRRIRV
ncbi:MAG: hypothetical protein IPL40_15670 [Proteobacteria bacterium]|nr:hypothetical protein [Pseudomonadota bacterium]